MKTPEPNPSYRSRHSGAELCIQKLEELDRLRSEFMTRLAVILKSRIHDRMEEAESEFHTYFLESGYALTATPSTSACPPFPEGMCYEAQKGCRTVRFHIPFQGRARSKPEYSFCLEYSGCSGRAIFRIPLLDPHGPPLPFFPLERGPDRNRIALLCSDRTHTINSYMDQLLEEVALLREIVNVNYRFPPLFYGLEVCTEDPDQGALPGHPRTPGRSDPCRGTPLYPALNALLRQLDAARDSGGG